MSTPLPHCQYFEERDAAAVVRDFLSRAEIEVFFAVSKDFYELRDQSHYQRTYAAYAAAFERIAGELKSSLGEPLFEGDWDDPDYPDDLVGERVVVWQVPDAVYLRLHHEDREVPIIIAFARADDRHD